MLAALIINTGYLKGCCVKDFEGVTRPIDKSDQLVMFAMDVARIPRNSCDISAP